MFYLHELPFLTLITTLGHIGYPPLYTWELRNREVQELAKHQEVGGRYVGEENQDPNIVFLTEKHTI